MPIRPLNPELMEVAKSMLNETPEKLQEGLQHITSWLEEQPHLHANTDEQWLASYIRGCDFDLDKVKEKLDLLYTCRDLAPDFYNLHHKDEKFKVLLKSGFYLPLPKLQSPGAPRITLIRTGPVGLSKNQIIDALCAVQIIDKILIIDDDNSIVAGNINIVDLSNTNLLQIFQLSPTDKKKIISQGDATPLRSSHTFFINSPAMIEEMMKGVHNSFHFYGRDYQEMYDNFLPKEIMPEEYGGSGGTIREIIDLWKAKIEAYDDWLEDDLQYSIDLSKKEGGPKTAQQMFGIETATGNIFEQMLGI